MSQLSRTIRLCTLHFRGYFYRFLHQWSEQLVVAIASSVILATFYYIVHDFLNEEIKSISTNMFSFFSLICSHTCLGIASIYSALILSHPPAKPVIDFAAISGELPTIGKWVKWTTSWISVCCIFTIAFGIILHSFNIWQTKELLWHSLFYLCVAVFIHYFIAKFSKRNTRKPLGSTSNIFAKEMSANKALVKWRSYYLIRYNTFRVTTIAGLILIGLAAFLWRPSESIALPVLLSMLTGIVTSSALAIYFSFDLKQTWIEKQVGVEHQQFEGAYEALTWRMGIPLALFAMVFLTASLLYRDASFSWNIIEGMLKISTIPLVPVLCMPWIMFQVDGKKPGINIIILCLVTLFIGTAIYVTLLGLALLPLLRYYGQKTQHNRFQRA